MLDNDKIQIEPSDSKTDSWYKFIYLSQKRRSIDKSSDVISNNGHTILTIPSTSIMAVTKFSGNFDSDSIIKNWEMRQNERFRYVYNVYTIFYFYITYFDFWEYIFL